MRFFSAPTPEYDAPSLREKCWSTVPESGLSHRKRRDSKRTPRLLGGVLVAFLTFVASACSGSGPQSTLNPKGPISKQIDDLWQLVYVLAFAVFIFVMGLLVWSIVRYRDKGDDIEPKQIHGNTVIELGGVVFSVVLLTIIGVPTVQTLLEIRAIPEGPDVIQVQVIGHQWWWEFEYPGFTSPDGRQLTTANELHIPADRTVNLNMTSFDVIHSFWVPALNGKRDSVPGQTSNLTLEADSVVLRDSDDHVPTDFGADLDPGLIAVIPGQCAEFCGLAHADMRIRVFVHTDGGFAEWVEEQLRPAALPRGVDDDDPSDAALGFTVFDVLCTTCHEATIINADGEVEVIGNRRAPNLTHFGSRATFGGATFLNDANHENLRAWLDNPSDLKPMDPDRNDIPAGRILGMPDLGLTTEEIDGLVQLLDSWQ